jgi:hypothetical protein
MSKGTNSRSVLAVKMGLFACGVEHSDFSRRGFHGALRGQLIGGSPPLSIRLLVRVRFTNLGLYW